MIKIINNNFSSYEIKFLEDLKIAYKNSYEIIHKNKKYFRVRCNSFDKYSKVTVIRKLKKFVGLGIVQIINLKQKLFIRFPKGEVMILRRRKIIPEKIRVQYEDIVSAYNTVMTTGKGYKLYPFPFEKHDKYIHLFRDVTEFLTKLQYRTNGSRRTISLKLLAVNFFREYERLTRDKKYKYFRIQLIKSNFIKNNFIQWVKRRDTTSMDKEWLKETRLLIQEVEKKGLEELAMMKKNKFSFVKEFLVDTEEFYSDKTDNEIIDEYGY